MELSVISAMGFQSPPFYTSCLRIHPYPRLCLPASTATAFFPSRRPVYLCFSAKPGRRASSAPATSIAPEMTEPEPLPAELRVTETKLPRSCVMLNVEVPPAVSQDCYKRVLDEFAKITMVPGFRRGDKGIPENYLVHYAGKKQVQKATIESILKRTLPNAMSSVKGRAVEDSVRIVTKFADLLKEFSLNNILRYDVLVDVAPEVKWLTENRYKNLKVVVEIDEDVAAERACEMEFKRRHKTLGSLRIVTGRGLQVGDLVVLDIYATTINEDESEGEKIPSAESLGFHLDTDEADNLLPGFLDSVLGIQQGETRTFQLLFPDTWVQENLRGIRARFTVECKEHFYRELPELNDSLSEKLLPGCETLSQVKESILQRCRELEQTAIEQATDNAILDRLSKIVEIDIPRSLFEEQGRLLYGAKLLELQARQKLDENQLAFLSSAKTVNEYLESQRENVTKIINQMLAVGEIFKCEKLEYSTDELVKEVENSIAEFKRHNQEYDEGRIKQQVQDILEAAKVLEWFRENADIQYIRR